MSSVYASKTAKKSRHAKRPDRWRLLYVSLIVLGALMVIGAGSAFAAVLLHGRGVLVAPSLQQQQQQNLQVGNIRLSKPLAPGGSADLLFSVRNSNAFGVRVDQLSLIGALRKAKPAGCTSKVTGPVTRRAGMRLPPAEQVLVGAGKQRNVVVHAAFILAKSARTGCGFTVEVDVSATQLPSTVSPTTDSPSPAPASTTTTGPAWPPGHPPVITTPPATITPTIDATMTPPDLPPGMGDCDPLDLSCIIPPGTLPG